MPVITNDTSFRKLYERTLMMAWYVLFNSSSDFCLILHFLFPLPAQENSQLLHRSATFILFCCFQSHQAFSKVNIDEAMSSFCVLRREGWDFWCLLPVWNLRVFSFLHLFVFYLIPFLLLAHSPDFFFPKPLPLSLSLSVGMQKISRCTHKNAEHNDLRWVSKIPSFC